MIPERVIGEIQDTLAGVGGRLRRASKEVEPLVDVFQAQHEPELEKLDDVDQSLFELYSKIEYILEQIQSARGGIRVLKLEPVKA